MDKEISCINSKAILDYVVQFKGLPYSALLGNLDPYIDALPNPAEYLSDPNNWISCTVASRLYKRAREVLKDEMTAFKIAKYAVENTKMGYAQGIVVKALWSSKTALRHAQRINDKWNRNKTVEIVSIKGNEGIVRLHWNPKMDVSKDFCLMNQGVYTYLPRIWGGSPLTFQEICCYFAGAPFCEYHLKWPARNRAYEVFSRFFASRSVLKETIEEMETGKKIIESKYEEVNRLNSELSHKIKQLLAIQETGKAILSVLDLEELLAVIMNILSSVCEINRALIMIVNEKEKRLEYLHGIGFDGEIPEEIRHYHVSLKRVSNLLVRVTNTGLAEYIPQVSTSRLKKENIILAYGRPSSVYVAPLITRSKVIGVIATDAVGPEGVPKETRETLEVFAPQIAIAIENARLYSELQEQMKELKRSHALLSRAEKFSFLGNLAARLAHEIKNPMTAIGTFIQMLPRKFDDHEFRTEFYRVALEETNRVNNLITELLDLVKTREPRYEYSDLRDLIDKMILLVSPQTNAKKIKVSHQVEPEISQVWLDSEKMKQVILNILSNAVEFTPQGGEITIRTGNARGNRDGGRIKIEIQDNGAGIPEANLEKVFDPYFTTKHRSDMHNGTGLGLFIAHQNMKDHNGTIEVKSRLNEGTTFILTLPGNPSSLSQAEGGGQRQ
jgi:signal transduction histidine kinase